jgi:hypothetical protein
LFGWIINYCKSLFQSAPPVREVIHIDTEGDLLEHFGHPTELEITDDMVQGIISPHDLGVIRLDDGELVHVPPYDRNTVRDQYFAELSDDDIISWLSEEGQVDDPDHLPYNRKCGF